MPPCGPVAVRTRDLLRPLIPLTVLATACSASPSRTASPRAVATTPQVASSAPPRSPAPTQCDPDHPSLQGFIEDDVSLRAARGTFPAVPVRTWHDETVRFDLPAAWFPSRRHEGEDVLYRVLTGDPDDVVAIYLGHQPALNPRDAGTFRVRLGGIAVRGSAVADPAGSQRLEAVAVVPCEGRAFVSVWARVRSPERFAAIVDVVRSIARAPREASTLAETPLDATRDRDALRSLARGDALATELVDRSLAAHTLAARYPLATDHPLADQLLSGHFATPIGAAPAEISVWLPVRAGHAEVPAPYRALHDPALTHAFASLVAAGCNATALQLGHDGVAVRCAGGTDARVVAGENPPATFWTDAVQDVVRLATARAAWTTHPERVGGWPAVLCGTEAWAIERVDGREIARTERCAIALDARGRIVSAGFTGRCEDLSTDAWSQPFRGAVHLDEIRGTGAGACTYTLGWNGRSAWGLAAGDGGTASAPLASGPVLAVNRRAVHTAVAFVVELERHVSGRGDGMPANVRPSVLTALGATRPGDESARALARRLRATGASAGPGLAVLGARVLDAERVAVEFLALSVELTETPQGWLVTAASLGPASPAPPPAPRGHGVRSPGSR